MLTWHLIGKRNEEYEKRVDLTDDVTDFAVYSLLTFSYPERKEDI